VIESPELTATRRAAIARLQAFLADHPHSPARGEMRFRLADVVLLQARGDFRVLAQRDRRALRMHLGADVRSGLDALFKAIERTLA